MRQPTTDFFVCNVFESPNHFKDDMASMEHPIFSLSTKLNTRTLRYEHNGNKITIIPSSLGIATIHDKDILLYCAGHLRAAINKGETPSPYVRFTAYDFFISTNRQTCGQYYKNFEDCLNRLRGTTINTNIKTGGITISKGFGLIDSWEAIKRDNKSRAIAIEIKVSDWLYNAVIANELLTINPAYFHLRKPIERRVYEIARKHCGDGASFKIGLDKLQNKIGTTAQIRKLRYQIREIEKTNHLPDYEISILDDLVIFTNRNYKEPVAISPQSEFPFLKTATYEKAHKAAPGFDIYNLEKQWREWIAKKKELPKRPDAAFIAFCRKKANALNGEWCNPKQEEVTQQQQQRQEKDDVAARKKRVQQLKRKFMEVRTSAAAAAYQQIPELLLQQWQDEFMQTQPPILRRNKTIGFENPRFRAFVMERLELPSIEDFLKQEGIQLQEEEKMWWQQV